VTLLEPKQLIRLEQPSLGAEGLRRTASGRCPAASDVPLGGGRSSGMRPAPQRAASIPMTLLRWGVRVLALSLLLWDGAAGEIPSPAIRSPAALAAPLLIPVAD